MAIVVMLLEDVALGAKIETRGRLVSARKQHQGLLCLDRPMRGERFSAGRASGGEDRHIHTHRHTSFSVKQQLDGCTTAIMNPIEGERQPGGQPFRGGLKAISPVPTFVYVCVSVSVCAHVCVGI